MFQTRFWGPIRIHMLNLAIAEVSSQPRFELSSHKSGSEDSESWWVSGWKDQSNHRWRSKATRSQQVSKRKREERIEKRKKEKMEKEAEEKAKKAWAEQQRVWISLHCWWLSRKRNKEKLIPFYRFKASSEKNTSRANSESASWKQKVSW